MRNICIYDDPDKKKLFKKLNIEMMAFNGPVYYCYVGHAYNPPFFNTLIYTEDNKDKDDYLMCWNMVLLDGFLILPKSVKYLFEKYKHEPIFKGDYFMIQKKTSIVNIFYKGQGTQGKYRVIDFMVIGVQKGGSTAAMTNLGKHPDIGLCDKEIHFYTRYWVKGIEWYKKHFDYSKKLVGEKDPNIIYMPNVFPMIQNINPCVKIILFLRNPINRAYSAWYMFSTLYTRDSMKHNIKQFEDYVDDELKYRINEPLNSSIADRHYVQRGLYYKQIKELLRYFPIQNIHIVLSENTRKNMEEEYNKIYDFLNIPHMKIDYKQENIGEYTKEQKEKDIPPHLRKRLIEFYKEDTEKLEKFLGYKTHWFDE
jgi:hypothetical protein